MVDESKLPGWSFDLGVNDGNTIMEDDDECEVGLEENDMLTDPDTAPSDIIDRSSNWGCVRRTRLENAMLEVMNEITDKPDWRTKINDDTVNSRWLQELKLALQPSIVESSSKHISGEVAERAAEFCIEELQHRAKEPLTTILGGGSADIVKFDEAPASLQQRFQQLSVKFAESENEPWLQPGDPAVRHLIHPSLTPLEFGRTRIRQDLADAAGRDSIIPVPPKIMHYSSMFQWLPAQWRGEFISSVPGSDPELRDVLSDLVKICVPLWERCIATNWGRGARRVDCVEEDTWVEPDELPPPPDEFEDVDDDLFNLEEAIEQDGEEYAKEEQIDKWKMKNRIPVCPMPGEWASFEPSTTHTPFKLPDELQIIVKLTELHLTPESPTYQGGSWHVEGLANEHICATAIFYYDVENIESKLAFDSIASMGSMPYEQSMFAGLERVFDYELTDGSADQALPSVKTQEGRILAFANVFRHAVLPMKLTDPTRPGHRKIAVLWLVNPQKPIISTAHVQHEELPREKILQNQRDLMAERSVGSKEYSNHRRTYFFCEH